MDIQAPEFHPLIDEDENFLIELNGVKFPKVTKGVGSIPGMADLSLEMWKIWERPGLAKRDRSIAIIAMLIAVRGTERQMAVHFQFGLDNGLTKEEIGELLILMANYSGWPAASVAAGVFVDLFGKE